MCRLTGRWLIIISVVAMFSGVGTSFAYGSEPGRAHASAAQRSSSHCRARRRCPRVGGRVRSAWPKTGRAPRTRLDRWLARQVGAVKPLACAKHWRKARRRCHLPGPPRRRAHVVSAAAMSAVLGDPGSPFGQLAKIAAGTPAPAGIHATASSASAIALPLQLVRSYQIPADDPSYNTLLNWSWTYDSAVAAAAFAATGDKANSGQLLDQLNALQRTDGSIELAFDTTTGEGAPTFRSGTVAWVGLAASSYDLAFGSGRYLTMEKRAADYLLSLQSDSGLIQGGPDVKWVSTQHNLIAYAFLTRLASELQSNGSTSTAAHYRAAAATISAAIDAHLLISDSPVRTLPPYTCDCAHFLEGLNDGVQALDVQALGAMYLQGTGRPALAVQVLAYAQTNFAITNRSIDPSSNAATYNTTYSAAGPFAGYTPYAGAGTPDVLWAEGSGEMRLAEASLGQDTNTMDQEHLQVGGDHLGQRSGTAAGRPHVQQRPRHSSTTCGPPRPPPPGPRCPKAPPRSSRLRCPPRRHWSTTGPRYAAATSSASSLTAASHGPRRAASGAFWPARPNATDYTVTSNASINYGSGYGVYVRASVDSSSKLTGYCVQLDHGYGELIVRLVQSDFELSPRSPGCPRRPASIGAHPTSSPSP